MKATARTYEGRPSASSRYNVGIGIAAVLEPGVTWFGPPRALAGEGEVPCTIAAKSHHVCNGFAEPVHFLFVHSGNIDTAAAYEVDAMFGS